ADAPANDGKRSTRSPSDRRESKVFVINAVDACFSAKTIGPKPLQFGWKLTSGVPAPLIEFYRNLGLLLSVAAVGSPAEICARTISELKGRIASKTVKGTSQYFPI